MHAARAYWLANQPDLMFVHLLDTDIVGHVRGWNSRAYLRAVERADTLIGQLISALEERDLLRHTLILVTSDHGGSGHNHGKNPMAESSIPWIMAGPGVAVGVELSASVNTTDTAPTVASVLGIQPPECAVGRRLTAALSGAGVQETSSLGPAGRVSY